MIFIADEISYAMTVKCWSWVFQVCFATCFDPNILANLQEYKGKLLRLKPTSADVVYR